MCVCFFFLGGGECLVQMCCNTTWNTNTHLYGIQTYLDVLTMCACTCISLSLSPPPHPNRNSAALHPILDPVHRLREHGRGVLVHGHPAAVPRGVRLGAEPQPLPAGRRSGEGGRHLCQEQHRRQPDDQHQAAGLLEGLSHFFTPPPPQSRIV